jgi:hypothetical protein
MKGQKPNDSIILDLSRARNRGNTNKYFCSYCNTRLTPLTQEDRIGAYLCTKCLIEYWPNQQPVKKSNRFETPGPDTDSHVNVVGDKTIPIAIIDDNLKKVSATAFRQIRLSAAYEALRKQGYHFVNYEER